MARSSLIGKILISVLLLVLLALPISGSIVSPVREKEDIRAYSRAYEFDYVTWTVNALGRKISQAALKVNRYLPAEDKKALVLEYLDLRNQLNSLETELSNMQADPQGSSGEEGLAEIQRELDQKRALREDLAPYVEQILQDQINASLIALDVSLGGQLLPPVLYRSEPNSYALIVSPRDEIRQEANLMLVRGLTLDQIVQLETEIEETLDMSALVVGIGGVGLYPSMIIESSNLDWLLHVIGHEWTHNYLTLRPLGASYNASPELRTINETIADLSADDIQRATFELFYPEFLPVEPVEDEDPGPAEEEAAIPLESAPDPVIEEPFDFRAEMHRTRLKVDQLLAEGKVEAAEAYMEARRQVFWENGYLIRRLNQAYFAFHGSYAAAPVGAASQEGADLGSLLRDLKDSTDYYREFMRLVAWRWKLEQFETLFEDLDS